MNRVVVVGGPGSGKSTLAKRVAAARSAVHVELDSIWWQPGWVPLEPTEFQDRVKEALGGLPRWVADGNYVDEVARELWPLADTLVWLDVRRPTAVRRAVFRSGRRLATSQELGNGNRERFNVLSPRSLARLWARWPSYGDSIGAALDSIDRAGLDVVRLTSSRDARRWLAAVDPA